MFSGLNPRADTRSNVSGADRLLPWLRIAPGRTAAATAGHRYLPKMGGGGLSRSCCARNRRRPSSLIGSVQLLVASRSISARRSRTAVGRSRSRSCRLMTSRFHPSSRSPSSPSQTTCALTRTPWMVAAGTPVIASKMASCRAHVASSLGFWWIAAAASSNCGQARLAWHLDGRALSAGPPGAIAGTVVRRISVTENRTEVFVGMTGGNFVGMRRLRGR
jgi:hypothetical protein